ncbi:hypothetical protein [Arthrobacter sp. B2a2-09]|uniref:hypothetical protein n=1 Tax=Arthrobacter sp. B2a2-09 TaxID=2952822 RepID=UPI002FCF7CBD
MTDSFTGPSGLFIDGGFRHASDGSVFPVEDPATGKTIVDVANGSVVDGLAAAEAAHRALVPWGACTPGSELKFSGPVLKS